MDAVQSEPRPTYPSVVRQILWPVKEPLFILAGSAIGLIGDLGGLVAERLRPDFVAWGFVGVTVAFGVECFRRSLRIDPVDQVAVQKVVRCIPCDLMRCGLFTVAAFTLLAWIGQGNSGVETIAGRLGIIETKVKRVETNTDLIVDAMRQQILIDNPSTAREHFHNAWIFQTVRNDSASAAKAISAVYEAGAILKIDAAQLYLDAHSAVRPRADVVAEMIEMGRRLRDPALIVMVARANQSDRTARDALMAEARTMDPSYPFAVHDPMVVNFSSGPMDARAQERRLRTEIERLQEFLRLFEAKPADHWAFMPRFLGDPTGGARMLIDTNRQTIKTYEDINSGALARRVRAQARRDFAR